MSSSLSIWILFWNCAKEIFVCVHDLWHEEDSVYGCSLVNATIVLYIVHNRNASRLENSMEEMKLSGFHIIRSAINRNRARIKGLWLKEWFSIKIVLIILLFKSGNPIHLVQSILILLCYDKKIIIKLAHIHGSHHKMNMCNWQIVCHLQGVVQKNHFRRKQHPINDFRAAKTDGFNQLNIRWHYIGNSIEIWPVSMNIFVYWTLNIANVVDLKLAYINETNLQSC